MTGSCPSAKAVGMVCARKDIMSSGGRDTKAKSVSPDREGQSGTIKAVGNRAMQVQCEAVCSIRVAAEADVVNVVQISGAHASARSLVRDRQVIDDPQPPPSDASPNQDSTPRQCKRALSVSADTLPHVYQFSPSQQGCERNALSPAADMLARPPKTARTTPVARSLYLSPSQHPFVGTSRPNSLREALQRNAQAAAPADVSLTPTGLQSALPISLAACRAASLSTPNSRLFRGSPMMPTTVPARPVASPITFVSPSHRLAPAPGLHMRPVLNAPLASGPPRSLAASLACNRNVPGSRWTPKRSLTALLHAAEGTAPSLLHRHHSFASPFEAASAHMPDPATLRPSLQLPLAAVPSVGSNADLGMRPSHDVLRHTQTPAASAALRSPSPPSARPSRRNSSRGLPPTHDRVPQGLAHASSLPRRPSGRAATPILSASPQHSVATPSCLVRPPPLEAPGAPIKRRPDGGDPADLLGRLSSLSVDSIDAGGVPWYHENSQSPPRVTPTRRILCFDSQGAGDVL